MTWTVTFDYYFDAHGTYNADGIGIGYTSTCDCRTSTTQFELGYMGDGAVVAESLVWGLSEYLDTTYLHVGGSSSLDSDADTPWTSVASFAATCAAAAAAPPAAAFSAHTSTSSVPAACVAAVCASAASGCASACASDCASDASC